MKIDTSERVTFITVIIIYPQLRIKKIWYDEISLCISVIVFKVQTIDAP